MMINGSIAKCYRAFFVIIYRFCIFVVKYNEK